MENIDQIAEKLENFNDWIAERDDVDEEVQEIIDSFQEDFKLIKDIKALMTDEDVDWSNPTQEQVSSIIAVSRRVRRAIKTK